MYKESNCVDAGMSQFLASGSQVYLYKESNCVAAGMSQFWPRGVGYTCTKNRTALMPKCPSFGLGESGIHVQRIELR